MQGMNAGCIVAAAAAWFLLTWRLMCSPGMVLSTTSPDALFALLLLLLLPGVC
jgi:nitrate reductase gamma subunit